MRGRPKKNKLITSLKVRTWFNAVQLASGLTAYELERRFSPPHLANDEEYAKRRPRLWEKYRLGVIEPSSKPIKGRVKSIAERVEEAYPGTMYWLRIPLWELADFDNPITLEEIRDIYQNIDPEINKYLVFKKSPDRSQIFWRNYSKSKAEDISEIYSIGGIDAIVALAAIIRESMICQDIDVFHEANFAIITLLEKPINAPLNSTASLLRKHLIKTFTSTWIPVAPEQFIKPFFDSKHFDIYVPRYNYKKGKHSA